MALPQQRAPMARHARRAVLPEPAHAAAATYLGPSIFIMQLPASSEEPMASPPP
jgi:hypothetical protein